MADGGPDDSDKVPTCSLPIQLLAKSAPAFYTPYTFLESFRNRLAKNFRYVHSVRLITPWLALLLASISDSSVCHLVHFAEEDKVWG